MNKKEKCLVEILSPSIEGASSNIYGKILKTLELLPLEAGEISFTLKELRTALIPLSKKWDSEIDKALNN